MAGPPPEGMVACKICGRNFNEDRIEKHESICKKTTTKKRKVFDVTKQRVEVRNLIDLIFILSPTLKSISFIDSKFNTIFYFPLNFFLFFLFEGNRS